MKEKIIQFGPENCMMGIVSEPRQTISDRPIILILNSGLIHRIGPYRMGVELARQLAELGFLVIRFDLSKIGDSTSYDSTLGFKERTISEIRAAMDMMERRYSVNQFISIGLCTGAMNSHLITSNDDRVLAAVMLDGYVYPTLRFHCNRLLQKSRNVFSSGNLLQKIGNLAGAKTISSGMSGLEGVDYWNLPPKSEISEDLLKMMVRKVELLFIYSGGMHYYFNYKNQLKDSFRSINFSGQVEIHYLKEMDHTYTLSSDRRQMLDVIVSWLKVKFPN